MNINFREITNENWIECIRLTTNKENQHMIFEEFIASNALSLAQSKIQDGWTTKAIYNGEKMVGFTMYGYSFEHEFYEICKLMIDYKYQKKGYGKVALLKVIEELKEIDECKDIYLCFDPENSMAKGLYENAGFVDTGKIINGELLFKLTLE